MSIVDTNKKYLSCVPPCIELLFIHNRGYVAKPLLKSLSIVKYLNIFRDLSNCMFSCGINDDDR